MTFGRSPHRSRVIGPLRFGAASSPPSEVVTRPMTAQERARLDALAPKPKNKEETDVKLTKDEYLQLRLQGQTREEIAAARGMAKGSLQTNYLRRWGIGREQVEAQAMEALRTADPAGDKPLVGGELEIREVEHPIGVQVPALTAALGAEANRAENPETTLSDRADEVLVDVAHYFGPPKAPGSPREELASLAVRLFADEMHQMIVALSLNLFADEIYQTACDKGWHDEPVALPTLIALIHSELSEALAADRKHLGDEAVAEELADVLIRLLDASRTLHLDVTGAALRKAAYNKTRPHRHGGLKY